MTTHWWSSSKFHHSGSTYAGNIFFHLHWKHSWGIFVWRVNLKSSILKFSKLGAAARWTVYCWTWAIWLTFSFVCVFFFFFLFFLFLFWEPRVWHAFFSLLWGYFWVPFPTLIYSAKAWDCYSSQTDRKNHSWKSSWKFHLSLAGPLRLWSDEMELSQFKESLSQPTPLLGLCLFPPPTPGMHSLFSV